jgi:hypothetical protein
MGIDPKRVLPKTAKAYREASAAGGLGGGNFTSMAEGMKNPEKWKFKTVAQKGMTVATSPIMIPLEATIKIGTAFEKAPRLAEWMQLEGKVSDRARAHAARNITVDFDKFGGSMKTLAKWVPFLNANEQGNLNLLKSFRDNPISIARFAIANIIPEVMLYMFNKQTGMDDKVDEWIKNNYWYIVTGSTAKTSTGEDVPVLITIRKGEYATNPGFIIPLGQIIRGSLDAMYEQNPGAFKMYAEKMLSDAPSDLANFALPPIAKTAMGAMANYDPFRKQEVIPSQMLQLEPYRQFTGYESGVARIVGEKMGKVPFLKKFAAPAMLEFVAKGFYPGVTQVTSLVDGLIDWGNKLGVTNINVPNRALVPKKNEWINRISTWVPLVRIPTGRGIKYDMLYEKIDEMKRGKATTVDIAKEAFYVALQEYQATDGSEESRKRIAEVVKLIPGSEADKKRHLYSWIRGYKKSSYTPEEKLMKSQSRQTQYLLKGIQDASASEGQ